MPDHRGQTYDPQEPSPRGGWFRLEERPYPERLDRAFRLLAIAAAFGGAAGLAWIVFAYGARPPADAEGYGWFALGLAIAAAMAYGFARGFGMILVGIYGTARDGSEFVVDWGAVRHDLPLRRTWVVILEGGLLLAAAGGSLWGLYLFARDGLVYGLAMFALIQTMTYWPFIRRRIATSRSRG